MIKIIVFKNESPNEIARLIEDFQNKNNLICKGTTIIFSNKEYVSFSYFSVDKDNKEELGLFNSNIKKEENKTKKRSFPTEKQVWRLQQIGYSDDEIELMDFEKAKDIINVYMNQQGNPNRATSFGEEKQNKTNTSLTSSQQTRKDKPVDYTINNKAHELNDGDLI